MSEHQHQWRTEHLYSVLNTPERHGIDRVAGVPDDEELTQPGVEQQLWRDAAVRAPDKHCEGNLCAGDRQSPVTVARRLDRRLVGEEVGIALLQPGQRLFGRERLTFTVVGQGGRYERTPRNSERAQTCAMKKGPA